MKMWRVTAIATIVILGFSGYLFAQSTPSGAKKELKFGIIAAITGPAAPWGIQIDRACRMAIDEINAKGGLTVKEGTFLIKPVTYDHKQLVSDGVSATQRAVFQDGIKYLVMAGGGPNIACAAITSKEKVAQFGCCMGGKRLTNPNHWYASRWLTSVVEGVRISHKHVINDFGVKKVAILTVDDEGGHDDAEQSVLLFKRHGATVVAEEYFDRSTTEFFPILTRILRQQPDLIETGPAPVGTVGPIIKQARELGYKGRFMSTSTLEPELIIKLSGGPQNAEGFILSRTWAEPPTKRFEDLLKRYREKFGADAPVSIAPENYDNVYIWVEAMKKANTIDTTEFYNTLEKMKFETSFGPGRFGGKGWYGINRQLITPMPFSLIKDGKVVKWLVDTPGEGD